MEKQDVESMEIEVRNGKSDRKAGGFPEKETSEFGVKLLVDEGSLSPKQSVCHYDYQLKITRALATCSIAAYDKSGHNTDRAMHCLEAAPSTGVNGLLWAKHLPSDQTVFHINCSSDDVVAARVTENVKRNQLQTKVNLLTFDPFSVNNDHSFFNFIYLEGFTNCAQYLDNIFRRMPRKSLVAISTADDPSLYCKNPEVAQRLYGGLIGKVLYYKELAARLIISAIARSAARANRGIKVLWCYSVKAYLSICVQIDKGPAKANESMKNVRNLIHCNICEDRAFYPDSNYVIENPYSLLSCECKSKMPGKTAINIGPVWSGELFDTTFLQRMIAETVGFPWKDELKELLEQLLDEAVCSSVKSLDESQEKIEAPSQETAPHKKIRMQIQLEKSAAPVFYYNLHQNRPKESKMLKADKIVTLLRNAGFRASRTHFDREAVRTSASLNELMQIIKTGCPAGEKV